MRSIDFNDILSLCESSLGSQGQDFDLDAD